MVKQLDLSIIGLGKLGACALAVYASKGFNVIGYDKNQNVSESIKSCVNIYKEPQLTNYLRKYKKNIDIVFNLEDILTKSKVSLIILPTPSKKDGSFSLDYIKKLFNQLKTYRDIIKKNNHKFILVSTTSPFSINNELIPHAENTLNLKEGKDFNIVYNPEFIALGSVIHDMLNPEFILVGINNKNNIKIVTDIYRKFFGKKKKINFMNIESAEFTKISFNAYVTMKLSFANLIGVISHNKKKIQSKLIANTLGQSSRISKSYFRPGLSFGGPCFPRDNKSYRHFFEKVLKINNPLSKATDEVNFLVEKLHIREIRKRLNRLKKINKILIIGSSFKENTPVITKAFSLEIIKNFKNKYKIYIYDTTDQIYLKKINKEVKFIKNFKMGFLRDKFTIICHDAYRVTKKIKKMKNINFYNCWF